MLATVSSNARKPLVKMENIVEDYINLNDRIEELDCLTPTSICFLPENIESAKSRSDFIYTDNTLTVKKLFRKNNLNSETLSEATLFGKKKSADWIAPTLFIGYSFLSENQVMISLALNVISNYLTDFFKGSFGEKKVKLEIVVETTAMKTYKKITYEGNPDGIRELGDLIKTLK